MSVMIFNELCLLIVVIYAGIYATVTDLKSSIIPNKLIIKMLVASIGLSTTYYGFYARDLIPLYFINLLCTAVFVFFFYAYNLWAAGDSKLLFLIMTAIPARAYYLNPFGPFPGFFVILLTFSIAFICIVVDSIYQGIKEKNLFKWSVQLPRLTDVIASYFFMVGSMTLVNILLINLFGYFFSISGLLITALDFLVVLSLIQVRMKINKIILNVATVVMWTLIIWVQGSDISIFFKNKLDIHAWMIVMVVMLLRMVSEKYNYQKVLVNDLKPRMIPSAHSVLMFQMSRVKGLPTCMTEDLRARLDSNQIDAIKRWMNSKNGKDYIIVVKKIPFAIYISIGSFLFLLIEILYFKNML